MQKGTETPVSMKDSYDLIVIGAGWYGLAAAKAYIELHPTEKIMVLESAGSCGGTWAAHRLYPGLKSNNLVGTYEYPDFPMTEEQYGIKPGEHIPGATLHQYLTDFAKKFGVFERTLFNNEVAGVEAVPTGGWLVTSSSSEGAKSHRTNKLIVATGLTSTPNFPKYPGAETFNAPLFHAKDFCMQAPTITGAKNAVVVGGAKSAFDVAYALVQQDSEVDLVIRPEGQGPVWISHPYVTPFKAKLEKLLHLRCLTWFSPCPWGGEDGFSKIRNFLHGTAVGRWVVNTFWKILTADVVDANGFDSHPEVAKLKPWNSAFWVGSGLSIHNYPSSLFDLVKTGKIRVHVADITHLSHKEVHLSTGNVLKADVCVCSTGWRKESSLKIKDVEGRPLDIGLPLSVAEKTKLNTQTDEKVFKMFPRLRDQPNLRSDAQSKKLSEPLRLYRFIVPPTLVSDRTIAFAGMVSSVSTSITASVQGLWISVYLDGKLDRLAKTKEEVTDEVMLHTQWGKWRYPCGYGANLPDFAFDALPYVDLMLRDLGVENQRKGGMLKEMFQTYGPEDFAGLVGEWRAGHEKGVKGKVY